MHLPHVAALAAAIVIVIAAPALAQEGEIERGPRAAWVEPSEPLAVPEDASGPLFVRRQDTLIRLEDGLEKSYAGWRIKLLNPSALQMGNITLNWNPDYGSPVIHSLKIYRDGTVIDLTDTAKFEVLRREDRLEQAMLTGVLTAVYNVPDLRVGDELEFEATTISRNPTFGNRDYGLLALAHQVTPGRFKLQLSWGEGEEPRVKMTPDLEPMTQRTDRSLTILADDPPTVRPPKDAPPRYQWLRVAEFTDFASWAELSSRFATLYTDASRLPGDSPLLAETARIAAAYPGEMDRAKAALKLVQDQVRYVYVGLNAGNLTPAHADTTWERRYGDCKGKTALLMALLDQLGIEAEAVMVNLTEGADDGYEDRLPNPMLFDHVLVRATIDGEAYWLDGTLPSVATPSREPRVNFHKVLPYRAAGADLEVLPWQPSTVPQDVTLSEIDASGGFDEPAKWTMINVTRGIEALQLYAAFSAIPRSQFESEFSNGVLADGTMEEVDSATWRFDESTGAMIMTVIGKAPVEWEDDPFGYELALPGGGFFPPDKRTRPSSQDASAPFYTAPFYSCSVTTLIFPSTTKTGNWSFNSSIDENLFGRSYYRQFDQRKDSITMVRGSRIERREIDPQEAAQDNQLIDDFDNSKANVLYDSGSTMRVVHEADVPVATDPVWQGANASCLPDRR